MATLCLCVVSNWKRSSFTAVLSKTSFATYWRKNTCRTHFSSSFCWQQQERQGQPGVFLFWLHRLLCGPGTDRSGDAHFQGCSTCPSVFGACLSRNTNHVGFDQRRNFRVVQVSWKYFHISFLFLFCLSWMYMYNVGSSLYQSFLVYTVRGVLLTWYK